MNFNDKKVLTGYPEKIGVRKNIVNNLAVQCGAVQSISVCRGEDQCSAPQCRAIQCSAVLQSIKGYTPRRAKQYNILS